MNLRSLCYFATRGYVQVLGNSNPNSRCKLRARRASKCCSLNLSDGLHPSSRHFSNDVPQKCWKCNYPKKSELFCSKCRALQDPPEDLNYFQIMGVPEEFDLKNTDIHNKYRQLQKLLHPDKFGNSSEKEKELSANMSSLINKAYGTLSHPLNRGLYMLGLKELEIQEGSSTLDPGFLMEIMEKNEEVEAASNDAEKVLRLIKENREILEDYTRQVSAAFSEQNIELAKTILIKMKYYASIETRLKTLKENLGIVE